MTSTICEEKINGDVEIGKNDRIVSKPDKSNG